MIKVHAREVADAVSRAVVSCWQCGALWKREAWALNKPTTLCGIDGRYFDAWCEQCYSRLFEPDKQQLMPWIGVAAISSNPTEAELLQARHALSTFDALPRGILLCRWPAPMTNRLVLELPEPPSLNEMIDLAKKRTRRSRTGGFMKQSLPVVYDQEKEKYELQCMAMTRTAGIFPPREPWPRWRIEAMEFRLHQIRDVLELAAGLKWTVDWLVHERFVLNDSPRELIGPLPDPIQRIDRKNRGITLTIQSLGGE